MKISKKLFGGENNGEETGRLYFDKNSHLMFISGTISWQLAAEFFSTLTGFESLPSRKPLTVYIDSEGGGTYAMFKIYDHIKNSPLPIITVVAGCALSAGFIIFLAGDLRVAFPNAFLGFHAPTIHFTGGSKEGPAEATETALHQNHILKTMVKIVKDNSNMPEKTIGEYFNVLTRIDAQTALKFGLAHQVIDPPKKVLPKPWRKIQKEPK